MKKALALLLVVVLALGMSTTAFAKIDKNQSADYPKWSRLDWDMNNGRDDCVRPGEEYFFNIEQTDFSPFTDPKAATSGYVVKKDITASKVTLRTKIAKGSVALDEVKFDYDTVAGEKDVARIKIKFVEPFKNNNTDGLDFDFTVFPVIDGKQYPNNGANFTGTLKNFTEEVDADTYYVNMEPGTIAEIKEYVKELEYDLGEGVSLFGKAIKNAKYWGVADTDPNEAQDEIMSKYNIDSVYTIQTIGLAGICNYVKLNDADPTAYVYDKDLKYLGRGKDKLAFSEVYYLSSKELDVEVEEEPEDEDPPTDEPVAPPEGGGDGYLDNVNDNPGTGK